MWLCVFPQWLDIWMLSVNGPHTLALKRVAYHITHATQNRKCIVKWKDYTYEKVQNGALSSYTLTDKKAAYHITYRVQRRKYILYKMRKLNTLHNILPDICYLLTPAQFLAQSLTKKNASIATKLILQQNSIKWIIYWPKQIYSSNSRKEG